MYASTSGERMKKLIVLALLMTAIAAGAQEPETPLMEPAESGLQLARLSRNHELLADFTGRVTVTGTLVAEWAGGIDSEYPDPEVVLVPDAGSIARLPHFSDYPVRHIELRNGRHALFMAVGEARANALLDRKLVRVEAAGTFVVADYSVAVECDASWTRGTMVSADIPGQRVAAVVAPIESC